MALTPLPTPPQRSDPPATFVTRADAFVAALPQFQVEINNLQVDVTAKQAIATQNASDAATSAATALAAANAATATTNITKWISGTTYAVGDNVYSLIDFQPYKRKVAGAGTLDPFNDSTNWAPLNRQTGSAIYLADNFGAL